MSLRVQIFFGTRPEVIKLAPLIRHCLEHPTKFDPIVCHTGQHTDLAQPVIDYFEIPITEAHKLLVPGQSLSDLHARCLQHASLSIDTHKPDCVVVQGDTTTALAAANAAFYARVPIVHVEAGLRTGQMDSPWPEEFNRRVISHIATLHCAPTQRAADQLISEGIPAESVLLSGNPVVDALIWTLQREKDNSAHWKQLYPMLEDRQLVLITGHRRENFGSSMRNMCLAIQRLARDHRDTVFVFPVHLNPHVQHATREHLDNEPNVFLLGPADYPGFVWLMSRSSLILTDSGGIQEESVSIQKPTLVMRDTTERPEAIQTGVAQLVGTDPDTICRHANAILGGRTPTISALKNPFGDGTSSRTIADRIYSEWGHD